MVLLKLLFTILSISYVFGIFLFANSPMVSDLARFNPYSLLHIPLYGVLSVLLIFSFLPFRFNPINPINHSFVPGGIALGVAIADEIHQSFIPGRDPSLTDVLLDLFGIILAFVIISRFHKHQPDSITQ